MRKTIQIALEFVFALSVGLAIGLEHGRSAGLLSFAVLHLLAGIRYEVTK